MAFEKISVSFTVKGKQDAAKSVSSSKVNQILREVGNKPGVLDTVAMQRFGLQKAFQGFDAKAVSPQDLGLVSKNLYALGLIDKTTAGLLVSAGTSLDAVGNQTAPTVKMNALTYFASRIDSLRSANVNGNEYGFHVVPDYIKAIHVLQNLDAFAKEGESAASVLRQQFGNNSVDTWA